MAFSQIAITAISQIPALVGTFAVARGWTVALAGSNRVLTVPGAEAFQVGVQSEVSTFATAALRLVADPLNSTPPGFSSVSLSPRLLGVEDTPSVATPTNLFLFGGTENSAPYIAGVIEFSSGNYRHFYIGSLVKYGTYDGGEIVSSNNHFTRQDDSRFTFSATSNRYMFNGYQDLNLAAESGFVHVPDSRVGADYLPFYQDPITNARDETPLDEHVMGGNRDRVGSVYQSFSSQHFAAATLLGAVNVYLTETGPTRYTPLGYVPGARMVNVGNIAPGARIDIGGVFYRVYPEMRRTGSATGAGGATGADGYGWLDSEASYKWGMAYAENAA